MNDMRIYSQLKPDVGGLESLIKAQAQLSATSQGRVLPKSELHMTVIHFGDVDKAYTKLRMNAHTKKDTFDASLGLMIEHLGKSSPDVPFELSHTGYERFGKNEKTIVATFEPNDKLIALHELQLTILKTFFEACGVENVVSYMEHDSNFVHALTIKPHVTLKKGHEYRDLPDVDLGTVSFEPMKVVY